MKESWFYNIFAFLKRSNRSFKGPDKLSQSEREKAHRDVYDKITDINAATLVSYPTSGEKISSHLLSVLSIQKEDFSLTKEEAQTWHQYFERGVIARGILVIRQT